ncbi:DUF4397 domain-containing protein [Tumebacillus flagellatus]|uniref:DUF4397 domain-containing protein n=1 Tax=Tumebacillus flagellatus TaxID=1157490 RepID=A0A074MA33_9BACL|nr:DUF4397 domain-containing protein [Tumebacillus flagellatus]KEO82822.1 hypothetical protein EL26_13005 [Tumebacillus flagellatus]
MKERRDVVTSEVATEVSKLVTLVQESQENQQAFLTEAYRLLQAQAREVEELQNRAISTEAILAKLDEIGKFLAKLAKHVNINVTKVEEQPGTPEMQPGSPAVPGGQPGGQQMMPGLQQPDMMPEPQVVPASEGGPAVDISVSEGVVTEDIPISEGVGEEAVPVVKPVHQPRAQVRFLHASPDAGRVDIYIDHKKYASDVAFQGITPYLPIEAGRHRLQVFPAGKAAGAIIDSTSNFTPGGHYTIAVSGFLRNLRSVVIEDHQKGAKPGYARAKVVHLSPNAPAVDVALPNGKVLLGHLTFKQKSPYFQVTPGTRHLELRAVGKPDVLLRVPPAKFDPNVTYTLYILGMSGHLTTMLVPEA